MDDLIAYEAGEGFRFRLHKTSLEPPKESQEDEPRPLINKPPPLNRGGNRDPSIEALQRRGLINHGST